MPTYDFRCNHCSEEFEKHISIDEEYPPCPSCGGQVSKLIRSSTFILKGDGWTSNENKSKWHG